MAYLVTFIVAALVAGCLLVGAIADHRNPDYQARHKK